MKKVFVLFIATMLAGTFAVKAQGGGGGGFRQSPEERLKNTKERLADLKLDKEQAAKTDSVFLEYFKAQSKMREEMMSGGGQPDREQMREKMQKMSADRDEKLKKIFTDEQYKKWKEEIEPSMRPQRGGNRGNN